MLSWAKKRLSFAWAVSRSHPSHAHEKKITLYKKFIAGDLFMTFSIMHDLEENLERFIIILPYICQLRKPQVVLKLLKNYFKGVYVAYKMCEAIRKFWAVHKGLVVFFYNVRSFLTKKTFKIICSEYNI